MIVSDELLAAYLDGELDAQQKQRVEQAIAHDPALALRAARQRALRERMRGAFDQVLAEPLPQRLVHAARLAAPAMQANVINLAQARADRARRQGGRGRIASRWLSIAASVLVGIGIGLLVQRLSSDGALSELRDGRVVARGALAQALNRQLTGAAASGSAVHIGVTFRSKAGGYCRTFSLDGSHPMAGLACREQQQWQLPTLLETHPGPAGANLRMAGSALPPALLQAVNERIDGEALDAVAERKAREQGWR